MKYAAGDIHQTLSGRRNSGRMVENAGGDHAARRGVVGNRVSLNDTQRRKSFLIFSEIDI